MATYAAPFRILTLAMLLPTVWGAAALPRFAALRDDPLALRQLLRVWALRLGLAGLVVCLLVTLAAPLVTAVLLGPAYAGAAPLLGLLIWMSFLVYQSAPFIAVLTAREWQMGIAGAVLFAGAVALALDVMLAPRFGLMAVAAVKVGTMGLLLASYALATRLALREGQTGRLPTISLRRAWAVLAVSPLAVLVWARRFPLRFEPFASLNFVFPAYRPEVWLGSVIASGALLFYGVASRLGLRPAARSETRWLAASGLAMAGYGWLSLGWAESPLLAVLPAANLTLGVLLMLALLAAPPPSRFVRYALAAGVLAQATIALTQFALQRDAGLHALGELALDPRQSGISVVVADGTRWLRAYGLSAHPNILGGYLAAALPFVLSGFALAKGAWRAGWGVVFVAGLASLLATFSRGAWLAWLIGMLVAAACWWAAGASRGAHWRGWAGLLAVCAALVGAFGVAYGPLVAQRLGVASQPDAVELRSASDRRVYGELTARIIRENLPLGAGLANGVVAMDALLADDWRDLDAQPVHRVPLLVLAELGLPGLALWMISLAAAARLALLRWPLSVAGGAALGALATLLVAGWFDHYLWTVPPMTLLWWGMLGLLESGERLAA